MKGTFFNKPLEYKLDVTGESWLQGDTISGSLAITSLNGEKINLSDQGIHLAYCQKKKLKAKDISALSEVQSQAINIDYSHTDFKFILNNDSKITEPAGNYYIICGDINDPFSIGMLELKILPIKIITDFIEVFELFHRFKFKVFKNKKDFIEAIITPPDSKEWAKIQQMAIQLKMNDDNLEAKLICSIKSISFDRSITSTKDEKKEINAILTKKDYELYGSSNQEGINKIITEMLSEIKLKPIL